ncbi:hypothetical protein HCN44_008692 [Aphidius gifuensis]|uniref:Uncharacterized protein n=2 Tax=Aphidius gifuensis TaxID=684658 RepID=A0A835CQB7_APHGI|nr:hypothetical protein HCN44_008692 [Aphidius gifuensis]
MADTNLYNSTICRLCGENNTNGEFLYTFENEESDLSSMINRYLPIKINNDGKLPRTICPGCNIQLEATVQFFERMIKGQEKIREIWKCQLEEEKKKARERLCIVDDNNIEKENKYLSENLFIKVLPDGSIFSADHDISLKIQGLEKPKRKRGRPPKVKIEKIITETEKAPPIIPVNEFESQDDDEKQEDDDEFDCEGRKRRRRKAPKRYSEAVQGKELERIFKEEGVIDNDDDGVVEDDDDEDDLDNNVNEANSEHDVRTEQHENITIPNDNEEIIGHLETQDGKDLGKFVTFNRNRGRGRPKLHRRKAKYTCSICQKRFAQRSRYITHKISHKQMKPVNDNEETNAYIDNEELLTKEKNNEYVLNDDTSAERGIDNDESVDLNNSNEYEIIDELDKTYDCYKCDKQYTTNELLDEHLLTDHPDNLTCTYCNETFQYELNLKGHLLTHENEKLEKNYSCDICGKVLNHPSSVIYHKEAEHNDGRRFVCNKCNKSFKHKQLLQRHQLVHSDDRPYTCKSCGAKFKTKANLINHGYTHTGEKKYTCEICDQQFAHKTSLTLHRRWHNGEKPFSCKICNKGFSQNGNLQEHLRIHTGEKPYSCDECDRKFTTSSQFKLHQKRHTGERPWQCDYCPKSFLHKDTWKCHVRRHTDDRPFQCSQCNKKFTEQWALKKHLRLHTGEKPYTCDICDKKFADCSNLTKHKKVHRDNNKLIEQNSNDKIINDDGTIWQVIPDPQIDVDNNQYLNNEQFIQTDDASEDKTSRFVYLSFPDPDSPSKSKTMNLNMIDDNDHADDAIDDDDDDNNTTVIDESLTNLDNIDKESIEDELNDKIDFSDPNLHLEITDEHGNPISITMQDAQHLFNGGQWTNGQIIKIQSDNVSGELCQDFDIHDSEEINFNNQHDELIQHDDKVIVDNGNHDGDDLDAVANVVQQLDDSNEAISITGDEQAYAIITQNGETYPVDTNSIDCNGEYMSID